MDLTYVPSWLTIGDRDAEGWPKFVTPEQRAWLIEQVTDYLTKHGPRHIGDIVYMVFRTPGHPDWVLLDVQYAAVHRALLEAGYHQVWAKESP